MTTHALEVTIAHINLLARVVASADSVTLNRFGICIQGGATTLADAATTLGLVRCEEEDHSSDTHNFRVWQGETTSAFGTFETTISLVETKFIGHRFETITIENGPECTDCGAWRYSVSNVNGPCGVNDRDHMAEIPADCDAASFS